MNHSYREPRLKCLARPRFAAGAATSPATGAQCRRRRPGARRPGACGRRWTDAWESPSVLVQGDDEVTREHEHQDVEGGDDDGGEERGSRADEEPATGLDAEEEEDGVEGQQAAADDPQEFLLIL